MLIGDHHAPALDLPSITDGSGPQDRRLAAVPPERGAPGIGYALIGFGGALWLVAIVTVLRDRRSSRARRITSAVVIAACGLAAILYWLRTSRP